jgi:hypothetical protein
MRERKVIVSLSVAGAEAVQVPATFQEFTLADRVRRSGMVMLVSVLLAATLIPIPIIHLLGIPLLLLTGVVLSIRQLSMIGRLKALSIACPKCGELNRVGGGLGRSSMAPQEHTCESCRRSLTLSIDAETASPVAGTTVHTS